MRKHHHQLRAESARLSLLNRGKKVISHTPFGKPEGRKTLKVVSGKSGGMRLFKRMSVGESTVSELQLTSISDLISAKIIILFSLVKVITGPMSPRTFFCDPIG